MGNRKPYKVSGRVPLFFGTTNETELITNKRLPRKLKKHIKKYSYKPVNSINDYINDLLIKTLLKGII